jgi:hypothetical protein
LVATLAYLDVTDFPHCDGDGGGGARRTRGWKTRKIGEAVGPCGVVCVAGCRCGRVHSPIPNVNTGFRGSADRPFT